MPVSLALPKTPRLTDVWPFWKVKTSGEPANTEHDNPLEFAVAQLVLGEPGPGG
jgi:hypothetical protein